MKSIIALACIFGAFAFVAQTAALPFPEVAAVGLAEIDAVSPGQDANVFDVIDDEHLNSRQKRATCDLLSFTGVNHSACAAHCVLRGKRGGYCNSRAVCVCRR